MTMYEPLNTLSRAIFNNQTDVLVKAARTKTVDFGTSESEI